MKKFEQLIDEKLISTTLNSGDTVTFLESRLIDDMVQINFPQKQLVEFIGKLKGGSKRKIFMQILG